MDEGVPSMRHGLIDVTKTEIHPESECYQPDCNWVSYGLFNSGIQVVIDPSKETNLKRTIEENGVTTLEFANNPARDNCAYVFPLADDAKMNHAAIS